MLFKKIVLILEIQVLLNVYDEFIDFGCEVSVYDPLVDKEKVIEIYNLNLIKEILKKEFDAIPNCSRT